MADRFHLFLVPMKAAHGEFVKYDELVKAQAERDAALQELSETESALRCEREWYEEARDAALQELSETESALRCEREWHEGVRDDRNKAWADLARMERSRDLWFKVSIVLAIATAFLSFWIKVTS